MSSSGASRGQTTPLASTPAGGTALVNGTPAIFSLAVPGDGKLHQYEISITTVVAVAETGGQVQVHYTSGGNAQSTTLSNGGLGVGSSINGTTLVADPGTVVQVLQTTALTAGAASVYCALSGG